MVEALAQVPLLLRKPTAVVLVNACKSWWLSFSQLKSSLRQSVCDFRVFVDKLNKYYGFRDVPDLVMSITDPIVCKYTKHVMLNFNLYRASIRYAECVLGQ